MAFDTPLYPVNLVLAGRRCLVVGGGSTASGKVAGLLKAEAAVKVVATRVGTEVRALDVQFDERPYQTSDLIGVRLVITATNDPTVNQAVLDDAEALGIWVNAADDPEHCTFILPAVVRRGPLMLTSSTAGHSPAVSSWLRGRLEREFGDEYGVLVVLMSQARKDARTRGQRLTSEDWQRALGSDMLDLIRADKVHEARELLQACLSSSSA